MTVRMHNRVKTGTKITLKAVDDAVEREVNQRPTVYKDIPVMR